MNADNLYDLPEWDDEFPPGDEEEITPTFIAGKALYNKWREVDFLLLGILPDSIEVEDSEQIYSVAGLIADSHYIGFTILTTNGGVFYSTLMSGAAKIREHASSINQGLILFAEEAIITNEHAKIVRDEIDSFRKLFIKWVNTFQKDELEDEWGLFV